MWWACPRPGWLLPLVCFWTKNCCGLGSALSLDIMSLSFPIDTLPYGCVGLVTSRAEPSFEHFELGLLIYE